MIYDYFPVTGAHDTVLDYADLFATTLRNDDVPEFDTRWDEVSLSMSKIPSDDILESLYKLRIRESDQLTTVLELGDLEIHQKISKPDYQKVENHGEKMYRSETTFTKLWRQAWENWNRSSGYESQVSTWCWKRTKRMLSTESKRTGVREEIVVVSGTMRISVQDRHQSPLLPLNHQQKKYGGSTSRRECLRGRSPPWKLARQPCRDYIKGKCTRPSCGFWHPPECQFTKKIGMQIRRQVYFNAQAGWRSTQQSRKTGDKSAVAFLKDARQLGCVFQDIEPPESSSIFAEEKKSWDQSDECNSQKPHCVTQTSEKTKINHLEWFNSKILINAVRKLQKKRISLWKRRRDAIDALAKTRGERPKVSWSSKKRTKLRFSHQLRFDVSQLHPQQNRKKENSM